MTQNINIESSIFIRYEVYTKKWYICFIYFKCSIAIVLSWGASCNAGNSASIVKMPSLLRDDLRFSIFKSLGKVNDRWYSLKTWNIL